ncbi:MAG: NnrU family protein, partial [Actinobacteria bacterium]|nr:NnrU family protein [Actinomycetota bacterium]
MTATGRPPSRKPSSDSVTRAGIVSWALLGMLLASILAVTGLSAPSPTSVGQERVLEGRDPARGVFRITRHPFMWAVGIWGI